MLQQVSLQRHVLVWVALSVAIGLLAVFLGLVGAFVGWFAQLFILIITVPIVLMLLDYRIGLMLAVLVMPYGNAPFIPRAAPLSMLNVLLLGVCLAFLLRWTLSRMTGTRIVIPLTRELRWFYLLPVTVAMLIGSSHLGEISPRYLDFAHIDSYGLKDYWVSLYLKMMLLVFMGCIHGAAIVERGNGLRFAVTTIVSGVLFVIGIFVMIAWTGVSFEMLKGARSLLFPILGNNNNQAAALLLVPLGCVLFMREFVTNRLTRNCLLGATLIIAVGVVLTFSRGGFMAMLFMLGFYVWHFKRLGLGLAVLTLVVAGAAVAPDAIRERLMTGLEDAPVSKQLTGSGAGGDELTAGRVWIWRQLAPEILRSPVVGRGLGSVQWSEAAKDGRYYANHPHNLYLEILMDLGLVGAVCIAIFYRYVWKLFRRLSEDERLMPAMRGYFLGSAAGLLGMLVYGFSNGNYYPASEQLYFWVNIGLALGYQRYLASQPPAPARDDVPKRSSAVRGHGFRVPEASILRPR